MCNIQVNTNILIVKILKMYVVDTVTEMGRDLGRNKDKNLIGLLKCKYFINNTDKYQ